MNFSLLDYLCCSKPSPLVTFQHTKLEFANSNVYFDLFCFMERTVIMDHDYLSVSHNYGKSSKRIPIMRDIGNVSGVARVTIPNEQGMYTVNYVRKEKKGDVIIGQITIPVIFTKDNQSTFDTETYSPKFLNTYHNHFLPFGSKKLENTWQPQVENSVSKRFQFFRGSH